MSADDDASLNELAGAILDGARVDWHAADSTAASEDRPLVRHLRSIAAITRLHRSEEPVAWGPLRLLERIGSGAFGDVYRAWDSRLDRQVALKLLAPDRSSSNRVASSIIEEGRLLARVRHPNVVTVHGAERIDDRVGLWMEFVDGRTLHQLVVEDRRRFSPAETATIGQALCDAVAAVHAAGLLHRDIKAQNVMMANDGRIVLMDFGSGGDRYRQPVDLAGTPLYLAPEVLNSETRSSVQSDVYSIGVLLFFLVSGTYPVAGTDLTALQSAHRRGDRASLKTAARGVPRRLRLVIERAIDPRPARRYQGADALSAALGASRRSLRTSSIVRAGGAAAAITLVALSWWEAVGHRIESAPTPLAPLDELVGSTVSRTGTASAERRVLAVMPFKNSGNQGSGDFLAEGLADEVIRGLASVQGLAVVSGASSSTFRSKPRDLRQIGQQLGATLVLEGSFLLSGSKLRITTQLVRVADDLRLWGDQFEEDAPNFVSASDAISRAVADTLGLKPATAHQRYSTTLDVYDLSRQAHALVTRRGMPNVQKAAELFERAIAMDPSFAVAHAGLATAYAFWSFPYRGIALDEAFPVMRAAATRALELDPLLAEAHQAMGWVYSYERDWAHAEESFQQAIRLNTSLTQIYTSYSVSTLQALQKYDDALRLLQAASRLDPLSLDVQREIGEVQLIAGRYAEAIETLQRVIDVEPDFPFVQTYFAKALMYTGRPEESIPRLEPGFPWLAKAYVLIGQQDKAEQLAAEWANHPYRLAIIAAALGDTERAIDALERAAVTESHRIGWLLVQPELKAVRDHPRVVLLRNALNLP